MSIRYLSVITVALLFASTLKVSAAFQQQEEETEETGDVILKPIPQNKDGIFKNNEPVYYKLQVRNNTNDYKNGKISYLVTTDEGKKVTLDSIHFTLNGFSSKELNIKIPPKATGFYRINFMVNLPDYDDTVRKVFGVAPEKINSPLHKPADFDAFWVHSREELEKVVPQYRVLERKDLSTNEKESLCSRDAFVR